MRLTLKLKLIAVFSVLVLALIGVAAFGILELRDYNLQVSRITEVYTPAQGLLLNADRDAQQALVAERSLLTLAPGSEEFDAQLASHGENVEQISERMEKYAALVDADWSRGMMEQFWPEFAAWTEASGTLVQDLSSAVTDQQQQALASRSISDLNATFDAMRDVIDSLDEELEGVINQEALEAAASYQSGRSLLTVLAAGASVVGIAGAAWLTVTISRGLSQAMAVSQRVAGGDLTETAVVRGRDEVADLLTSQNEMILKLRAIVTEVSGGAGQVSSGS
ncbi:methyl-accepting chemotaxis protein, partial [Rubellimicrobium rubrum]